MCSTAERAGEADADVPSAERGAHRAAAAAPYDELPAALALAAARGALAGGEVVFLGTGAAMPSKYRNVSSTLVRLPAGACVLLDCGEGTLGQLRRRFGFDAAAELLVTVACIWISHAHADHHLGLPAVLAERARALRARNGTCAALRAALVVGPRRLEPWLAACVPAVLRADSFTFAHCSAVHARLPALDAQLAAQAGRAAPLLGVCAASAVHVEHCADAWALLLTVRSAQRAQAAGAPAGAPCADGDVEWSVGYSGDTRPCEAFVRAAQRAPHLLALIHEATFEDALGAEAVSRRHSTVSEAMDVGVRTGAYRVLLTHFSQRYPKVASASAESSVALRRTLFATDLMSVPFELLRWAPAVTRPAQLLLNAEDGDEDERPVAAPPAAAEAQ